MTKRKILPKASVESTAAFITLALTVPPCLGHGEGQLPPAWADHLQPADGPMLRDWMVDAEGPVPRRNSAAWKEAMESVQDWLGQKPSEWHEFRRILRDMWDVWCWATHARVALGVQPSEAFEAVTRVERLLIEARQGKSVDRDACLCPSCRLDAWSSHFDATPETVTKRSGSPGLN